MTLSLEYAKGPRISNSAMTQTLRFCTLEKNSFLKCSRDNGGVEVGIAEFEIKVLGWKFTESS